MRLHAFHAGSFAARLALVLALGATPALAAEGPSEPAHGAAHAYHVHHVSFFTGATTVEGHRSLTTGADYEWRMNRWIGVMGLVDTAFSQPRELLAGGGLTVHPTSTVRVAVLPVIERTGAETVIDHGEAHHHPAHYAKAVRTALSVGMPVGGRWVLEPTVAVNFAAGRRSTVAGVTIGAGF